MAEETTKLYISQIKLPDGKTYWVKDEDARKLIDALSNKQRYVISKGADTTPEGIQWEQDGTIITGTVAPSSIAPIYLVPAKTSHGKDIYDEYISVLVKEKNPDLPDDEDIFAWEKLGDTEIDFSNLGNLAYANTASGSISNVVTNVSSTFKDGTAEVSSTYTPTGTVGSSFAGTALVSTGSFKPEGKITSTLSNASGTFSTSYTPTGSISNTFTGTSFTSTGNVKAAGTVSAPAITITPNVSEKAASKCLTNGNVTQGSTPSFTEGQFHEGSFKQGTDQFVKPTLTTTVAGETLTIDFSQGSFTQGQDSYTSASKDKDTWDEGTITTVDLPTFSDVNILESVSAALATAPVFSGTSVEVSVSGTPTGSVSSTFEGIADTIEATGNVAGTVTSEFTGTSGNVSVSGTPAGTISSTFDGTEATIKSTGTAKGTVETSVIKETKTVTVTPDAK